LIFTTDIELNSTNSRKKRADGIAVHKLILIILLPFLIFTSGAFFKSLKASESEATTPGSANLSETDEQLIDQFLDETLGIDPTKVAIEKLPLPAIRPSSASGFSLYSGYGFEKNILTSDWLNLSSRKFVTTADFYYSRRRYQANNLNYYVFLDNSHYPDLDVESDKQELFTRAQGKFWITKTNALGLSLSYLYKLTFDTDNAVKDQPIPKYQNEEYIVAPSWEKDFGNNCFFVTELESFYRRTQASADDFDRFKLITLLKKLYGRGSESRITLYTDRSLYNEGETLDLDGYPIEDTKLRIESQSLGFFNSHYWSGSGRINLKSNLVLSTQKDNGPGYYNYSYYYLGETFQLRLAEWNFSSTLRYTLFQYSERKGSSTEGDPEEMYNRLFEVDTKVEKQFGDNLSVKFETVSLQSDSNDLSLVYASDSLLLGVIWFF